MTSTREAIAIAEEVGVLKQLSQHHGGGLGGVEAAFRQRAMILHPDVCGEAGKFAALVAARDALRAQASAIEKALLRRQEDTP